MRDLLSSLERYSQSTPEERSTLAHSIATALGADYVPTTQTFGQLGLAGIIHQPTQIVLVAVPGGQFQMGLTEADIEEASEYVDFTKHVAAFIAELEQCCRPVRDVQVAPFLCSTRLLSKAAAGYFGGGAAADDCLDQDQIEAFIGACTELRLPAEAELEYLARDGSQYAFVSDAARIWSETRRWPKEGGLGVGELTNGEWAQDHWHDNYAGAPADSRAWLEKKGPRVIRGGLPVGVDQSADELLWGLSAYRTRPEEYVEGIGLRLARDLPLF